MTDNKMSDSGADSSALFNPPWDPGPTLASTFDVLSLAFPIAAGLLSVGSGIGALRGMDNLAAMLGILAGVVSALGVIFTGLASRVRDGRLAVAGQQLRSASAWQTLKTGCPQASEARNQMIGNQTSKRPYKEPFKVRGKYLFGYWLPFFGFRDLFPPTELTIHSGLTVRENRAGVGVLRNGLLSGVRRGHWSRPA